MMSCQPTLAAQAIFFPAVTRLSFVVLFRKIKWLLSACGDKTVRRMLGIEEQTPC